MSTPKKIVIDLVKEMSDEISYEATVYEVVKLAISKQAIPGLDITKELNQNYIDQLLKRLMLTGKFN